MKQKTCSFKCLCTGITFFLLSVNSLPGNAQSEVSYRRGPTQLEDILPPSPEAVSRVKYADVPFTHSTGAAEYSVPIYEIKGRRLTIPISLDYCSNGIKLDEIAGVAGLGWSLNAGGCITREVVYMPDEFTDGTFSYKWPNGSVLQNLLARSTDNTTLAFLRDVAWNRIDTNADRYSYSVLGLKGQFIIDPDGTVIQLQGDGVDILYDEVVVNGKLEKIFTIIGPDGTVYSFDCRETGVKKGQYREVTFSTGQQVDWEATTAWFLTEVTSRDGSESASFSYQDGGTWDRSTRLITKTVTATPSTNTSGYDENCTTSVEIVESSHDTKVLTGIILSGFTASFAYSETTSRSLHSVASGSDAANYPQCLSNITVTNASGAQLVRAETVTNRHSYDGRILLEGINIYRSGTLDDRWSFTYNTTSHTVSRYSQDWFGYFNGENGDWINFHIRPLTSGASRNDLCPYLLNTSPNYSLNLAYGVPDAPEASYMMLTSADHDGARTNWIYEGCLTGSSVSVGGTMVPVSVGVRVKEIRVLDGNTLKQVRSFTYGGPATNTSVSPIPEAYLSTSANMVLNDNVLPSTGTAWVFTLNELPITDGQTMASARVWYGTVTEDISPDGAPVGNRTVYTYDTTPVCNPSYNTLSRFPSTWQSTYSGASLGISPFSGIESAYCYDGAIEAPRLIKKEIWRHNSSTEESELVEKEEISYSSFSSTSQLTGYKTVRVMQRIAEGIIYDQDFQHYPLYSQRRLESAPSSVTIIGYNASGNDTTRIAYNTSRASYSQPIRNNTMTVSTSDAVRFVSYTYPDTWGSDSPSWATALSSSHALSEPLKKTWRIAIPDALSTEQTLLPFIPRPLGDVSMVESVTEYSTFNNKLMPSRTIEYVNGTESWSEEILERDILGNPVSIKEKGRPVTSIIWSYDGLYPVAVIEGAAYSSVVSALGGQNFVNTVTRSSMLSSAQQAELNGLRTSSQTSSSHVTTLTYAPGIGTLSIMNPAGIMTSYTYDHGGRLASVTDTRGQTIDEYTYCLLNGGDNRFSTTHHIYTSTGKGSSYCDVKWWDTLGMRLEDIAVSASGTGNEDLVTAYESDYMLHDDVRVWLPYPASGTEGTFRSEAASAAATYHNNTSAYHGRTYEESSRDKVIHTTLPGYASHPDDTYTDAVSGFPILLWRDGAVEVCGDYSPGDLVSYKIKDADGRVAYSIKDHHGRIIATGYEGSGTGWNSSTRYVYDVNDRLSAVVGAGIPVTDTLSMWRYAYDRLGRIHSKGIPGSVREYYTYDSEDRIITVTRGNEFTEIDYDSFGRITAKYITVGSGTRTLVEAHQYDSYSSAATTLIGGISFISGPVKGLETWSSLSVTDGQGGFSGTANTAYAYDSLGRLARSVTQYPDGHENTTVISYDFAGNPTSTVVTGVRPGGETTDVLSVTTTYDARERPLCTVSVLAIGGEEKALNTTTFSYDALGRQSAVSSGPTSSAGLLESQYDYSLQQWISAITASLGGRTVFSEMLGYDSPSPSMGGPSYSGLITRKDETWTIPTGPLPSQIQSVSRTEEYVYDYAARLSAWDDGSNGENISYDSRGNITSKIQRYGNGDSIIQTYIGDRLATRKEGNGMEISFAHDSFGRLTADAEEGLSIAYNVFELPEQLISQDSTLKVKYTYLSDGTKLSALDGTGTGLVYRGPFIYRLSSDGEINFESAPFESGRLTEAGTRYYITDHLGSVRAVIDGNISTSTFPLTGFFSVDDFAPFGIKFTSDAASYISIASTGSTVSLRDGFTGQEDQMPDFSVGYIDFGARQYSPTISRWLVPDPMGEKYYDVSPYAYCNNGPICFIDNEGKDPIYAKSFWGRVKRIGDDGKRSLGSYLVRGATIKKVKHSSKAGQFFTGDLSESKTVMLIPTGQLLEGVLQSYEDTKRSRKENGGHSIIGENTVIRWDEGPEAIAFSKNGISGAKATLRMFVINGTQKMPLDASKVKMWWHTHPDTTVNGISLGDSIPSAADLSKQKEMVEKGYKGNSFVVGTRTGKVTFFNEVRPLITIDWKDFLRMGGQEQ